MSPREWADLPPTQFTSRFTLQQKNPTGTSFASQTKRFQPALQGGYNSNSVAVKSSFRANNAFHKAKVTPKDQIRNERPLWLSEINKEAPPGANYNIEGIFGTKNTLLKSKAFTIKNSYAAYKKTCDIEPAIQVFNANSEDKTAGVASYDIDRGMKAVKKQVPKYSVTKAKQFVLWEEETKRASEVPAATSYNQSDSVMKSARYSQISMGKGKRVTDAKIMLSPGPGHYSHENKQMAKTFNTLGRQGLKPYSSQITSETLTSAFKQGSNFEQMASRSKASWLLNCDQAKEAREEKKRGHMFGAPASLDLKETIYSKFGTAGKIEQPPLIVGKARPSPSDIFLKDKSLSRNHIASSTTGFDNHKDYLRFVALQNDQNSDINFDEYQTVRPKESERIFKATKRRISRSPNEETTTFNIPNGKEKHFMSPQISRQANMTVSYKESKTPVADSQNRFNFGQNFNQMSAEEVETAV